MDESTVTSAERDGGQPRPSVYVADSYQCVCAGTEEIYNNKSFIITSPQRKKHLPLGCGNDCLFSEMYQSSAEEL